MRVFSDMRIRRAAGPSGFALATLLAVSSVAAVPLSGHEVSIPLLIGGGGGGVSRGGGIAIVATLGQAAPIGRAGETVAVDGGFWPAASGGSAAAGCEGDCNGDGAVTIDELVRGVSLALGVAGLAACAALDSNGDDGVTIAELIAAVNSALNGCAAARGPLVTRVTPEGPAAIVPFSVVRIVGTSFGDQDALHRVTIGGREATIVDAPAPDTLLAIVPLVPAGPADLLVFDGDRSGPPFRVAVATAAPLDEPDTLDAVLGLLDLELERFAGLELEAAYGENTAAVRAGIAQFRQDLAAQRASLRGADPATRARLDAIVDAAGVADLLHELFAAATAAAPQGATTVLAAAQRLGQATRVVGALAGAAGASLTIPELVLIGTGAAIVAGVVSLGAANVAAPVLLAATYTGLLGEARQYPTVSGQVRVIGERLDALTTSLVVRTPQREWRQPGHGCGAGCLTFSLPGDRGFCGGVILRLARGPLRSAQQIGTRVQPELIDLTPDEIAPHAYVTVNTRGTAGCEAAVRALHRPGDESGPIEVGLSDDQGALRMRALALPPARYALSVSVLGIESSEQQPLRVLPTDTDLNLSCLAAALRVGERTTCFGSGNGGGTAYTELVWASSTPGVVALAPVGPGFDDRVTAIGLRPGTTTLTASARSQLDGHVFLTSSTGVPLSVTDDRAPVVSVSPDPPDAPTTVAPGGTIRVRVLAEDATGVKLIRLAAQGDAVVSTQQEELCVLLQELCEASFSVRVKQSGFTQREITIFASALDTSDNVGRSSALTFLVDAPIPTPTPTSTPTLTPDPAGAWVLAQRLDPALPTPSTYSFFTRHGNSVNHQFRSNGIYATPDWEFELSWDDPPEVLRADEEVTVRVRGRMVRRGEGGARGVSMYLFSTTCLSCVDSEELRIGYKLNGYSEADARDLPLAVQYPWNTEKPEHQLSIYFQGGGLRGPVATYVYQRR